MHYKEDGSDIKIGLACSFYMEYENLKRQLPSLHLEDPYSPDVGLYFDGVYDFFRFRHRPTPKLSDDGSRELIHKYSKILLFDFPGYQSIKRQKYVDTAVEHHCDVLLIIDADEYVHPDFHDWQLFRKKLVQFIEKYDAEGKGIIFNLPMYFEKDYEKAHNIMETGKWLMYPRIWHRPETMEYFGGVHYWVRHRTRASFTERLGSTAISVYEGIRFVSDTRLRNEDFKKSRDEWAKKGMDHEKKLIEVFELFNGKPPAEAFSASGKIINPLVCILQPRDIPQFTDSVKSELQIADKYWIKYHVQGLAYDKMREIFLKHTEYSHLVILPDDLIITKEAYARIYDDLTRNDYSVISGWCNLDRDNPTLSNICIDDLPPNPPHLGKLTDYKFATMQELTDLRKKFGWQVIEVKYAGFPLTFIRRDVVEQIPFREDDGCCPDSLFAIDLHDKKIPQFVDLGAKMYHMKLADNEYENMQVGIKPPETKWEMREIF
jgi:hypothetical protein